MGWQFFSPHKGKIFVHPMVKQKKNEKNSFLIVCPNIHQNFLPKTLFISLEQLATRWWNLWFLSFLRYHRLLLLKRNLFTDAKCEEDFPGSSFDTSFHSAYFEPNCRIIKHTSFSIRRKQKQLWKWTWKLFLRAP